jgi:hypothetical protein
MLNGSLDKLARAVMQTVAYSDIFDYPLTAREIHRYLTGVHATFEEVALALDEGLVMQTGDYFTLPGREGLSHIRIQREKRSRKLLPIAIRYGRILGALPYIRMVALTGSLAMLNISKHVDFDYLLVTSPGRVWTARAFALLLNRLVRSSGHTICPNLILAETALGWPLHDLYSARELYQMIPITGMDVYQRLLETNQWAREYLPNCSHDSSREQSATDVATTIKLFFELPLRGKFGDRLEQWEMNRKIARFKKQAGFGEETLFNAEVCQGNFHHHRKWTLEALQQRLDSLKNNSSLPVAEGLGMRAT